MPIKREFICFAPAGLIQKMKEAPWLNVWVVKKIQGKTRQIFSGISFGKQRLARPAIEVEEHVKFTITDEAGSIFLIKGALNSLATYALRLASFGDWTLVDCDKLRIKFADQQIFPTRDHIARIKYTVAIEIK